MLIINNMKENNEINNSNCQKNTNIKKYLADERYITLHDKSIDRIN